ncbi:ABC transporter ATP-binding protein [Alcaligenaceae bacterium]|nr:ABC transporter ATP-binding protein [Alcaligenaceae bacterium]
MNTLLTVENLQVRAGSRTLVAGIDLTLKEGEFLAVIGESGSGKSVTAMACCGLLPPELTAQGGIRYARHDLLALAPTEWRALRRNGMAAIFQDPMSSLNPLMKVSAQLAEAIDGGTRLDDASADTARSLLREVGLHDTGRVLNAYSYELSGGQQQRVLIAMALATNPRLLIADEPTTALDASTQSQVIELLQRLRRQRGMAILMVTHDLSIVRSVADSIAVFHQGRCVEQGRAAAVITHPRHDYTRALVRASMQRVDLPPGPPSQPPLAVLRAQDVAFRYPNAGRKALNGVGLSLSAGECLGVVGESGSGKSTLAKILVGAMQADAGAIEVCGLSPRDRWRDTRRNLAFARKCQYIFQDTTGSLNPSHTVARTLREALLRSGDTLAETGRLAGLMTEVGLDAELLTRRPDGLSGGQRQRVVIARALAMNPEVLVCDEPVSALDAHLQKQIVNLLVRLLRSRRMAMVFIGHDLGLMSQFCDRIAVMDHGEIVEQGATLNLMSAPESEALRTLMDHSFASAAEAARPNARLSCAA